MEDIYRQVGDSVRARRAQLGWTQEELGEASGLHPSYIGQIERGDKKVSLRTLAMLAKALGATLGELLDEPRPRSTNKWAAKIDGLLREKSSSEKELLYSTLRHLSRRMRGRK